MPSMRTGSGWLCRGALRAAALILGLSPAVAAEGVATALVVSVDVSQSVDDTRFRLQMEGIAEALEDPSVVGAITGNPGGILFAMVTWADRANLAVGWRRIASRADAAATAALVARPLDRRASSPASARCSARSPRGCCRRCPMPAERVVIDVSGDGIDNCHRRRQPRGRAPGAARHRRDGQRPADPGSGRERRGRGRRLPGPGYGLRATPLPQERTSLEQWYRAHVIGGRARSCWRRPATAILAGPAAEIRDRDQRAGPMIAARWGFRRACLWQGPGAQPLGSTAGLCPAPAKGLALLKT